MKQPSEKNQVEVAVDQDRVIRLMPESLANKIAAGEVVQRPASVVKELIENAIDAGAENVTVHVSGAGSDLIQVIDDGCGMGPQDARACFLRHATSKIASIEDLETVRTLGFRGEALASIASVSHVTLRTRRHGDDVGVEIVLEGGTIQSERPGAAARGTTISVRNLFFNVPARRKFLKRPATELKHIVETVEVAALANPAIGFRLLQGESELLSFAQADDLDRSEALRRRIGAALSPGDAEKLIRVGEATSYMSVAGFIGSPSHFKRSRGQQYLFVNGRSIKHRSLEHAVSSAYEYLLPEGAFPLFVLFLDIDPRHVDVNVHPAKAEVKFDDESGVYGMLRTIVRRAVGTAEMMPDALSAVPLTLPALDLSGFEVNRRASQSGTVRFGGASSGAAGESTGGTWMDAGEVSQLLYDRSHLEGVPSGSSQARPDDDRGSGSEDLLWQLHDAYVLTQIRSGLVIVDQQAAHERILYEQATRSLADGFGLSQQLLFPIPMDLSPGDYALLEDLWKDLRSLGFDLESTGNGTVLLRGVPADIPSGEEHAILSEVFEQYRSRERVDSLEGKENLARCIARRGAVRPGSRLSRKEMRMMIDRLFMCEMPWVTPDGRPTIIRLSVDELRERFGRGPA